METAIGVFHSREKAEQAIKQLLNRHVPKESIAFLTTSETDATKLAREFGGWAGAFAGGAAGMTASVVAATLLIPGVGPAIAVGIGVTALLGVAGAGAGSVTAKAFSTEHIVPQLTNGEDAELFGKILKDGRSIVIVRSDVRNVVATACEVLDHAGMGIQEKTSIGRMQTKTRHDGAITIVEISGKITLGEGTTMLRDIVQGLLLEKKNHIVFSVAGVDHIDSAGIGELVRAHTSIRRTGGQFKLASASGKLYDLLVMTRLNTVFDLQRDDESAIRAFDGARGQVAN